MANPLTFYVPIKQDPITQDKAKLAYDNFAASVQKGLDASHIVHYARLALIPNPSGEGILAICLITTFDGPMNPYLKYFWNARCKLCSRGWPRSRSIRRTRR